MVGHQRTARLGALLRLDPPSLEAKFWRQPALGRLLAFCDVVAFTFVLPNALLAMLGRVRTSLPADLELPPGAKVILLLYWALTAAPVGLMLLGQKAYVRWRSPVVLLSRAYRVVASALLTHPATLLGVVTQVASVRASVLQGDIVRALLVNTLLPTAWHMQQAFVLVPFRAAVAFQLGCLAVAAMWSRGMPCWLPLPASLGSGAPGQALSAHLAHLPREALVPRSAAEGAQHAAAFQQAATTACHALQLLPAMLWVPQGALTDRDHHLCEGAAAFQLLFLWAAMMLLLLGLPGLWFLERAAKCQFLRAHGMELTTDDESHPQVPRSHCWRGPWGIPWSASLLLLPPACCWILSESLTSVLGSHCRPPLGSTAFEWMGGLF